MRVTSIAWHRASSLVLMVLSLFSQPVYMSLVRRALPGGHGPDWNAPDAHAAVVEHAVAFVRAGLAVDTGEEGVTS